MNEPTKQFWEATYRQSIAKMIGLCYRYTLDQQTAEDLAHDAFLLAIDKASSFENKGPFEAWLRRIVVNVALQHCRAQKIQQHHQDRIAYELTLLESTEPINDQPDTTFSEAELLTAISRLPQHHRLVFNLYVFDDFTHAQIAAELGIREGTSKSHLARARKQIRAILATKANHPLTRKRLWLWSWLPDGLGRTDQWLKSQFARFQLQPQQGSPIDQLQLKDVSMPKLTPNLGLTAPFLTCDLASLALVVNIASVCFLQVNAHQARPAPVVIEKPAERLGAESFSRPHTEKNNIDGARSTATFSTKTILTGTQTKTSEKMKQVNTLGALLLSSSALAVDPTGLMTHAPLPNRSINQLVIENKVRDIVRRIDQVPAFPTLDSPELVGTFYASELFWSAQNNELYVRGGQVNVNFGKQQFRGSGEFSFLGKVSHVVVDGVTLPLGETLQLTEKKYGLVKLSVGEAIKKYGDVAKLGAVEIRLAE